MRRLSTTVLTVVGPEAEACVRWFADAANVTSVATPHGVSDDIGPNGGAGLDVAAEVWRRVVRSNGRYTMHAADPLGEVAMAWSAAFDGSPRGTLETVVERVIGLWRRDGIGLPDYYLVLEPNELPEADKSWYLGVLHEACAHRVIPVAAESAALADAIARLPAGRWWPDLPDLLGNLERTLPDQPMLAASNTEPDHRSLVSGRIEPVVDRRL